jgi:small conductance mechanosensitive channel
MMRGSENFMNLHNIIPSLQLLLIDQGLNLLGAVIILIVGWIVAGWLSNLADRGLSRLANFDPTLKPLFVKTVRYVIIGVTLLAVLQRFGFQTTSLIAILGAAGLALGLALQGTLSDVAAGVMLLFLRPFAVGDTIQASGTTGTVREIGLFTTNVVTPDMIFVSLPNGKIFGSVITNYSRELTRRINFTVGIDYADDIDKAQQIALDILKSDPRVLDIPAPSVPVGELAASSVNLIVRCWVASSDYGTALFDLQKAVKLAFDKGGIGMPFPQQTLSFRTDSPNPFAQKGDAKS